MKNWVAEGIASDVNDFNQQAFLLGLSREIDEQTFLREKVQND